MSAGTASGPPAGPLVDLAVASGARRVVWSPGLAPPGWRGAELVDGRARASAAPPAARPEWLAGLTPGDVRRVGRERLAGWPPARARGLRELVLARGASELVLALESPGRLELDERRLRTTLEALSSGAGPDRTVGEARAGLAHDLRNQLTLASLECERLLAGGSSASPHARALAAALTEARELCAGLFDGGPGDPPRRVALRALLERELAAALELSGRAGELRVELRCPRALEATLRPAALARCVRNLALNALQASGPGGRVRVAAEIAGPRLELEVLDEGRGMSPEELERCLRPGHSGRGSTGLGTASVLACVDELGGELELDSELGAGTRVRLSLPVGD